MKICADEEFLGSKGA